MSGSKDPRIVSAEREAAKVLDRLFRGEIEKLDKLFAANRAMHDHVRALESTFSNELPEVAQIYVRAIVEREVQKRSLKRDALNLHIWTAPYSGTSSASYFDNSLGFEAYGNLVDSLRGDPESPLDPTAQVWAHILIIINVVSGKSAVHICLIPNGTRDVPHCPVSVWPTALLNSDERGVLGI
jgi:hypothetical protein